MTEGTQKELFVLVLSGVDRPVIVRVTSFQFTLEGIRLGPLLIAQLSGLSPDLKGAFVLLCYRYIFSCGKQAQEVTILSKFV